MTRRKQILQNSTSIFFVCIAVLLFASACSQQAPPDTRIADQIAIRETDAQWSKAAAARDVDSTVSYYTDDASVLSPNAPIATDKKSVRAIWTEMLVPALSVSWQVSKVEVARSGDLGVVVGTYQITPADPQSKIPSDRGKMVEVFKKQADGKWKCEVDIFNSDLPLPPAAPPADKKK
jgi:ketosteroid isomerase-like protein